VLRFEWNALRVGDKVLVHDLSVSFGQSLPPLPNPLIPWDQITLPPRPEPLPWPDEPDWTRPVEIRFELEGHPAWPGWWQERGAAPGASPPLAEQQPGPALPALWRS
jgi:hypothetical protein